MSWVDFFENFNKREGGVFRTREYVVLKLFLIFVKLCVSGKRKTYTFIFGLRGSKGSLST